MKYLFILILIPTFCKGLSQENKSSHYLFPKFQKTKVLMDKGKIIEAEMNYNLLSEEMVYSSNGKMLALSNTYQVDTVFLGASKFIPAGTKFYEIVYKSRISLYIQHRKKLSPGGKPAGYGGTTETSAVTSVSSLETSGVVYKLDLPDNYKISDNSLYWLLIGNNWLSFATERQFVKLFPDKEQDLKNFIKSNKTNFKEVADVTALVKYLNEI